MSGYYFEEKPYQLKVDIKNETATVLFSILEEIQFQYPSDLVAVLSSNAFQECEGENFFNIWERKVPLENLIDSLETICRLLP